MKTFSTVLPLAAVWSATSVAAGVLQGRAASITPITVKGNGKHNCCTPYTKGVLTDHSLAFYKGNDRFYLKGVDYQPGA